jgi:hypothetical protein
MAVSYNGSRVSISNYKNGTTAASSTTNLQITSGEIVAGDVGRLVAVYPSGTNSGETQVRQITGVSGGTISIHDPWVGTIPSGTTWRVAHNLEDVHAIGDPDLQKIGTSTYRWNADWSITDNGFFGDVDIALEMTSSNSTSYPVGSDAVVQFGILYGGEGSGRETTKGCRLHFRTTGSNASVYSSDNDRDGDGGVVNYYGCLIESDNAGNWAFQRMVGPARFIGCNFDGTMGGRFYHEASEWVDCRMSGNDTDTVAWSMGASFTRPIENVFFFRNGMAMKNYIDFSGTFRNVTFASNDDILLRSASSSGSVFNYIDCTEFGNADIVDNGGVVNQYRSVLINTTDGGGAALSGVAFRINNDDDTTQGSVQESDGSGNLDEVLCLRRRWNHNSTTLLTYAPFRFRYRKYGYLWQELNSAVADPIKQGVAMLEDDAVTQTEAAAQAHTGITVTDHGGSPVTWNSKSWGITVTVDGPSADDVKHYLHYHLSQTAGFAGKASGLDWHEFIPAMADETRRGDYGGTWKGVRIVDTGGNPFPGFDRLQADDGTYYSPPESFTLQLLGLETGSQVVVYETGTTTIIDSTNSSGASYTYSDTGVAPTVDYTVIKGGFEPIRVTGVALSGGTITSQSPGQAEDREYDSLHGLTYGTDWSVDIGAGTITVGVATTGRSIYSALIDAYIARESDTANTEVPLSMDGNSTLTLDGMEFTAGSVDNLSRTGFRYVASGVETAVYAALQTPTLPAGTKLFTLSTDGGSWSLLDTGTGFDGMHQVFGDASHGSLDNQDFLTIKAINDGYTISEWNLVSDGGVSEIADSFYFVPLSISLTGETTGDPGALDVTVTNIVDETWNGITVGVEIDTGAGVSGSEIMRYLTWEQYSGNLLQYGQLVLPLGNNYQSVRGRVYDGTPLDIEGVKVLQNGSIHPDFSLFEGEPGETYTPPVTVVGSVSFDQTGSRIQVYNETTDTEIANEIVAGTVWTETQLLNSSTYWDDGDTIRVRLTYVDGTTAKQKATASTVVGSSENWSLTIAQPDCTVYNTYGIDGSTVTEFSWDSSNVEFDVNDPDNTWYVARLFAWDKYHTFTEIGIRDAFEYISAADAGNIQIANTAALDNLKSVTAMQGDNIRLFRPNGTLPVVNPTTGGGGFTFYSTGAIYIAETGVSGLTAPESATLNKLNDTLDANIVEVNSIPVTGSGTEVNPWGP